LIVASCSSDDGSGGDEATTEGYAATIRRTANGVPHITAGDLGSLGFGQGFAFAQDHACTLIDQIVKVRGERARWRIGPVALTTLLATGHAADPRAAILSRCGDSTGERSTGGRVGSDLSRARW
jgi:acyl-homoserine lactone acylase PvdQ